MDITASVVQGSGLGPAAYVVTAADLWPKCTGNSIVKFVDDTYLIIPAANSHTCEDEVSHVETWAASNNLHLNCAKSHEIVFRSRRLRGKADQPAPRYTFRNYILLLVRIHIVYGGQTSNRRWRLSSFVVVVCNTRICNVTNEGQHATAG